MSNYTSENLIQVAPQNVPAGTLLIKIGDDVFTAGAINIDEYGTAYVAVSDSGTIKAQRLAFDGTQPSDSGVPQSIQNVMIFQTGHPEPVVPTPAASINFYKCTAVQASQSTWTGRLADISESTGIWTFQSTSTTGLSYTNRLVPVVDNVYMGQTCVCKIVGYYTGGIPTDGLVFYYSFDGQHTTVSDIGNKAIDIYGNVTFTSEDTVQCASISNGYIHFDKIQTITDSQDFTATFWFKPTANTGNNNTVVCWTPGMTNYGDTGLTFYTKSTVGNMGVGTYNNHSLYSYSDVSQDIPSWHMYTIVSRGGSFYFYRDAALDGLYSAWSINPDSRNGGFGQPNGAWPGLSSGYVAAARVYNRALSDEQITSLASQFTPTV